MALATSTSSVSSIVYEANPSTSDAAMPASSSAATMARQAKVFSDSGSCFAKAVCPIAGYRRRVLECRHRHLPGRHDC